jgi:hypothetical protein
MNFWQTEQGYYNSLTLQTDGDCLEKDAANHHGLHASFPNYVLFWRRHVAPATNRPASIGLRTTADRVIRSIAQTSHGILTDLVHASAALEAVNRGDYGDGRLKNFSDLIKNFGDSLQKFRNLHDLVKNQLASVLGTKINLWPGDEFKTKWEPRRNLVADYRNFSTHNSYPFFHSPAGPTGTGVPHVLHPLFLPKGKDLLWDETEHIHLAHPEHLADIVAVGAFLRGHTISYLNDAYESVLAVMDPLLIQDNYLRLRGTADLTILQGRVVSGLISGSSGPPASGSLGAMGAQSYRPRDSCGGHLPSSGFGPTDPGA